MIKRKSHWLIKFMSLNFKKGQASQLWIFITTIKNQVRAFTLSNQLIQSPGLKIQDLQEHLAD